MDTTIIDKIKKVVRGSYTPQDYPTLEFQARQWSDTKSLQGLRVLDATPVFGNTLSKYIPLMEAGAEVVVGISEVMPRDERVVEFLRQIGVRVVEPGACVEDCGGEVDIVLDCAAAFAGLSARVGYVELTRSGVSGYEGCAKPVFVADSSRIKRIETSLGTGEGYFRAMAQLGYAERADEWTGRELVIFGNGKVGSGLAIYGRRYGAKVSVFDENSDPRVVRQAIGTAYAVVTATGVRGALECYATELCGSSALLANMGVEDEFSELVPVERVLAEKRPLNFILDEPTHLRYIETTMALHNHGALEVMGCGESCGFIYPSAELEGQMLAIVERAGSIGDEMHDI